MLVVINVEITTSTLVVYVVLSNEVMWIR